MAAVAAMADREPSRVELPLPSGVGSSMRMNGRARDSVPLRSPGSVVQRACRRIRIHELYQPICCRDGETYERPVSGSIGALDYVSAAWNPSEPHVGSICIQHDVSNLVRRRI